MEHYNDKEISMQSLQIKQYYQNTETPSLNSAVINLRLCLGKHEQGGLYAAPSQNSDKY